jgi:hypothetical protein
VSSSVHRASPHCPGKEGCLQLGSMNVVPSSSICPSVSWIFGEPDSWIAKSSRLQTHSGLVCEGGVRGIGLARHLVHLQEPPAPVQVGARLGVGRDPGGQDCHVRPVRIHLSHRAAGVIVDGARVHRRLRRRLGRLLSQCRSAAREQQTEYRNDDDRQPGHSSRSRRTPWRHDDPPSPDRGQIACRQPLSPGVSQPVTGVPLSERGNPRDPSERIAMGSIAPSTPYSELHPRFRGDNPADIAGVGENGGTPPRFPLAPP